MAPTTSSTTRPKTSKRGPENSPAVAAANFAELIGWYAEGRVKVSVEQTYPLADTVAALEHVMGRQVQGKVAITFGDAG